MSKKGRKRTLGEGANEDEGVVEEMKRDEEGEERWNCGDGQR